MGQIHPAGTQTPGRQKFVSGYNNFGSTMPIGSVVVWDVSEGDCKAFTEPTTAEGGLMVGILTEAVLDGADTDRIQTYGIVEARVEATADVVAGDSLKPVTSENYLVQDASGALSADTQAFTAIDARTDNDVGLSTVFVNLPG